MSNSEFFCTVTVTTTDGKETEHNYALSKLTPREFAVFLDETLPNVGKALEEKMAFLRLDHPIAFYKSNRLVRVSVETHGSEEQVEKVRGPLGFRT